MSSNELVEQIMAQVIARVATPEHEVLPETTHQTRETAMAEKSCTLTEFVGTAIGDTVGLVIANVDSALLDAMKLEKRYRSIGILGARIGAGPHIMAADEAVKATNTEVISIELPRDTKGGAGHGSLILLGGNDVSDVKRGIEVALKELDRTFGDVYANETESTQTKPCHHHRLVLWWLNLQFLACYQVPLCFLGTYLLYFPSPFLWRFLLPVR